MTPFPTIDEARIEALEAIGGTILSVFKAKRYARIQPSLLQPSDIFVDRSGEEIRRRTLELTDPSGREVCLRPDLTIPACHYAVEAKLPLPARLCYRGPAFRWRKGQPAAIAQAGAELIGAGSRTSADGEMLALAVETLRAVGLNDLDFTIGDLKLFSALIDALEVPAQWRGRLKRHFWRSGYFEQLLAGMVAGADSRAVEGLHVLPPEDSRAKIEALIDCEEESPFAGRLREDIVSRLMQQAADGASPKLSPAVAETILRFRAVRGPARLALEDIRTLSKPVEAAMAKTVAGVERRLAALEAAGIAADRIAFVGHFGRNLEYYTGFVFEVRVGAHEVAGGGRYDTLMESLGAAPGTTAIGCALAPEAVLDAGGRA